MDDIKGDEVMLTIFLRHDQSQSLDEFQPKLDARGWWENFPPEGVKIVSWNVVMGIGQIVTLRFLPDRLQAVNVALEKYAWGVFSTETFATYDFLGVRERLAKQSKDKMSFDVKPGMESKEINSGAGGGNHPRLPHNGLYMKKWQARNEPPTEYETVLGDALEEIFEQGIHELSGLVRELNHKGVKTPDGESWTEENFPLMIARLAG